MWHQPPRQVLGAVLLEAGRAREAEAVYREDLERFRENGWSLFGLWQSLEAQQKTRRGAAGAGALRQGVGARRHHADVVTNHARGAAQ